MTRHPVSVHDTPITLKDIFRHEFSHTVRLEKKKRVFSATRGIDVEIIAKVYDDFTKNVRFISYYVPRTTGTFWICCHLLREPEIALSIENEVLVKETYDSGNVTLFRHLPFSGKIIFYIEDMLTAPEEKMLFDEAIRYGRSVAIRGPRYLENEIKSFRPFAFISHDQRDRNDVVQPLADRLMSMLCPVTYDDFSLKPGDDLIEHIEKGIQECSKCILILSPNFIESGGSTKAEFNAIVSGEMLGGRAVLFPVWHRVGRKEVYEYCPRLADTVGVPWSLGAEEVARRLCKVITTSKTEE